jgi:hypothetical protein
MIVRYCLTVSYANLRRVIGLHGEHIEGTYT